MEIFEGPWPGALHPLILVGYSEQRYGQMLAGAMSCGSHGEFFG